MTERNEWVTVARLGAIDVVRVAGEVDTANAPAIGAEAAAHTRDATAVLLDLTAVPFIDSAGVRLLDTMLGTFAERGTAVRLVVPATGAVRLALTLCAFPDELLETDLAAAAASLQEPPRA
ncbi:MAG TPA: STAS domain-containing protein [Pilimelia sp.]|nr:STAS domain-containing protein [Pilimelia sp.]